ncbi:O-antigen ligase family protein, partial [Georgenia sp.]
SQIVGLLAGVLWLLTRLERTTGVGGRAQPIRIAMLLFVLAVLVSYVAAMIRPIAGEEISGADRGLLLVLSLTGVVLVASESPPLEHVTTLVRRLSIAGGVVAALGLVQFVTGDAVIDVIQIPGLSENNTLTSIYDRNGIVRAAGTATHPIEFGVVLAMLLPLTLHVAMTDTHRGRLVRWLPVAAIALAIPVSVSRSAIVGVVVALVIVMSAWTRHARLVALGAITTVLMVVFVTVPGMLGTLTRLFTGISTDGSARSRTDSYGIAFDFIERSPIVGRGFSTFLPRYRILDNQFLGLLIETGIIGVCATLLLFGAAFVTALRLRKQTTDATVRSMSLALGAMVAVGTFSFATFDAFGFPQVVSLLFLGIGLIAGLRMTLRATGP